MARQQSGAEVLGLARARRPQQVAAARKVGRRERVCALVRKGAAQRRVVVRRVCDGDGRAQRLAQPNVDARDARLELIHDGVVHERLVEGGRVVEFPLHELAPARRLRRLGRHRRFAHLLDAVLQDALEDRLRLTELGKEQLGLGDRVANLLGVLVGVAQRRLVLDARFAADDRVDPVLDGLDGGRGGRRRRRRRPRRTHRRETVPCLDALFCHASHEQAGRTVLDLGVRGALPAHGLLLDAKEGRRWDRRAWVGCSVVVRGWRKWRRRGRWWHRAVTQQVFHGWRRGWRWAGCIVRVPEPSIDKPQPW